MTRIYFERTGGFAGLRFSTDVDSQSLGEDESLWLEQEIDRAGFFTLPPRIQSPGGGVDRFEYHITVVEEHREYSVEVSEAAMPDSLRPLVEHLERLMRTRRR